MEIIDKSESSGMIHSPFTEDQIKNLNKYQDSGQFHPFTCPNDGDEKHVAFEFEKEHAGEDYEEYLKGEIEKGIPFPEMSFNQTSLVATKDGWMCPVCDYKQYWAHEFMADKKHNEEMDKCLNAPIHTFINPGFNLSTDYKLLWDLIQKGQRIPAWLVYTDEYKEPIWDIVEVKKSIWTDCKYSIGVRGIGYENKQTFEGFEMVCKKYSLHFVLPKI